MLKYSIYFLLSLSLTLPGLKAQNGLLQSQGYQLMLTDSLSALPVISQGNTGTCWSFSCSSFLESELIRMGKNPVDLSEMYPVRMTYPLKAEQYVRYHGKNQLDEGSLGHDVIQVVARHGLVPQSAYSGVINSEEGLDHGKMIKEVQKYMKKVLKKQDKPSAWQAGLDAILDEYMGAPPESFEYEGKTYTPRSFADALGIKPNEYVSFTSFSHHPFYSSVVLEVPDNFSHGVFYNLPIDELEAVALHALKNGFSVEWDGDVSNKGFSARKGIGIAPAKDWDAMEAEEIAAAFAKPGEEKSVSQEIRQAAFDNYSLTDDHLMHLTGLAKDQNGNPYFQIKNSWGSRLAFGGHVYASSAYFKMYTVSILVHKDAVPKEIWEKIKGLN